MLKNQQKITGQNAHTKSSPNQLVLGIDVGSNSIGWSVVQETDQKVEKIIDMGVRIFNKSVEDKAPISKNVARRDARLARRVIERRARRKLRMRNYLISVALLPNELKDNSNPEQILNDIGNPYELRAKALDDQLTPHQFGRVLLHFVARRGFLSSKKQLAGDLVNDSDVIKYLSVIETEKNIKDKEEKGFIKDISELRATIEKSGFRTLGEYLYQTKDLPYLRNRSHTEVEKIIRTDRQMYKDELQLIWQKQQTYFQNLPTDFYAQISAIIFYQRPLKLIKDRVGKCSLEPKNQRARMARLEVQEFRYLQQINQIEYLDQSNDCMVKISLDQKQKLAQYLKQNEKITLIEIKKKLGLRKNDKLNIQSQVRGNTTSITIQKAIGTETWHSLSETEQGALVEDLLSIKKKSALKKRLENHWKLSQEQSIKLCLEEFEPEFSNLSLKAINKLLPFLRAGLIYSDARIKAGYGYEQQKFEVLDKLPKPPETRNPVVNKAMSELRKVVNALSVKYGKPGVIRVEMARDLEMSTKRYKAFIKQQESNEKANQLASEDCNSITGKKYPSKNDKIKHRLWKDQERFCAYSGRAIGITQLFTEQVQVDHILPYKKSLDNSYMNKVVCFANENQFKSDKTPIDAFGNDAQKWTQISQRISKWDKSLSKKVDRFYQREADLLKRDFIKNQLNDTRYIARLSLDYLKLLGSVVTTTKGQATAWLRHSWGLNSLISEQSNQQKDRTDHRHHAIDALVIACINPSLHNQIENYCQSNVRDLNFTEPFSDFRKQIEEHLKQLIVAHDVKRKLSGALHEDTGLGMIEQGGMVRPVARVPINNITKESQLENIVDEEIKKWLKIYLNEKCDGNYQKAFNSKKIVCHKDDKTPIYRLRVFKSKPMRREEFFKSKLVIKDKNGKPFKFYKYGNTHHLEIFKHPETEQIKARFITTLKASERAKGIGRKKQPMIKKDYQDGFDFLMVLHTNDIVSVIKPGDNPETAQRRYYRVQKFGATSKRITLRGHLAANIDNKQQEILMTVNSNNLKKYDLRKHRLSVIGDFLD